MAFFSAGHDVNKICHVIIYHCSLDPFNIVICCKHFFGLILSLFVRSAFVSGYGDSHEQVYMGDLERGLQYMLTKEIPNDNLDELSLNAVYQLLENMVRYLPWRNPVRHFLIALRDWPILMELKAVRGQDYAQKVVSCFLLVGGGDWR